jgi:hypothetical protein
MNFKKTADVFNWLSLIFALIGMAYGDFIFPAIILFAFFIVFNGFEVGWLTPIIMAILAILIIVSYQFYYLFEHKQTLTSNIALLVSSITTSVGLFFLGKTSE